MSSFEQRRAARRPKPRNRLVRAVAVAILGVVVLLVGVAIGRALADGPAPGGTQTSVRTLEAGAACAGCDDSHDYCL